MTQTPDSPIADSHGERHTLSSETVYEGRIWDVVVDKFTLDADDNATVITRDYIEHTGAVSIVALDDEQRVLLIKQYRQPAKMTFWEIPAGLLDVDGEPLQHAAARELAEEADVSAQQWNVLADFHNSPGSSSEVQRVFLARGISQIPDDERHERTDEEAEIEVAWIPLDDAVTAVLEGRLHSPSAVVGILAASAAQRDGFETLRPADAPFPEHPRYRD